MFTVDFFTCLDWMSKTVKCSGLTCFRKRKGGCRFYSRWRHFML